MKNKILIIFLAIITVLSCAFGCACNGKKPPDGGATTPDNKEPSISLNYKSLSMDLYETVQLKAFLKNTTGTVVWSSTDEGIVVVDQTGLVTSVKEGNAAVRATIGEKVATCTISVVNSQKAPVLFVSNENVSVAKDGTYDLSVLTKYKDNEVLDIIEYTWTKVSGDDNIVELEQSNNGSAVTVKGLNFGTVKYYVSATVYGIYLVEEVSISVVDSSVSFDFKNINLSTDGYYLDLATFETLDAKKTFTVDVDLYVDNALTENAKDSLTWESENTEIATVSNGVITAISKGVTYVKVSYQGNEARIKIIVNVPVAETVTLDKVVSVDKSESGAFSINLNSQNIDAGSVESVAIANIEYTNYQFDNGVLTLSRELLIDNKIYGNQTISLTAGVYENDNLVAYKLVNIPALVITKTLRTKEDINLISTLSKAESDNPIVWGGYFVLGNDIEYNGTFTSFIDWAKFDAVGKGKAYYTNTEFGFVGTIDGNGYYIDGLTMGAGSGGLFGAISTSACIKNISFTNVVLNGGASLICESGDGLIENVFVQCVEQMQGWSVNDGQKSGFFFTYFSGANATIKNCFVETDISKASSTGVHPLGLGTVANEKNLINAYCVGSTVGAVVFNNKSTFTPYDNNDVYGAYADYNEFKEAVTEFNTWDSSFWTVNNDLPVPRHLLEAGKCLVSYKVEHVKESGLDTNVFDTIVETETLYGYPGKLTEANAMDYVGYQAVDFEQQVISLNGDTIVIINYEKLPNYYTINHWFSKDEINKYSLYKQERIFATAGTTTSAVAVDIDGFTARPFTNDIVLDEYQTVIDIYYTKDASIENFEGINASGNETPIAAKKLLDDDGDEFNIFVNNVTGLKYSVVEENGNKVLKFENVNQGAIVGTWIGVILTEEQYSGLSQGKVLSFDIKINKENGYYTENKTSRIVEIGTDWTTIVITKEMGEVVFPTANATYNQYIYFMHTFTPDSCVWIDNIRVSSSVEYTVKHYKETALGSGEFTVLEEQETLQGIVGNYTNAVANEYVGYKAKEFSQVKITASGNVVVEIYYEKLPNGYTVNHWFSKDDITKYSLYKSERILAETGDITNANPITVEGFTATSFENVEVLESGETVVDIYYTKDTIIESFDGINANGWGTPVAGSKLLDNDGDEFNIFVNNVSGLKYSVVEENSNKVLKLENVEKDGITGTWVGLVLTAEQYEAIQSGGSLSFDIKSSIEGTYTENKTGRTVSISTDWATITLNTTECNTVFPTANATYNQYIYFMYGFPANSTIFIDNIIVVNKTNYTVNHYLYKTTTESDGAILYKTETIFSEVGTLTNAQAIVLDNYTAKAFENVVIGEETVIDIYYTRNSMLVESAEYVAIKNLYWSGNQAIATTDSDATQLTNFYMGAPESSTMAIANSMDGCGKAVKYNVVGQKYIGFMLTLEQSTALSDGGTLSFWAKVEGENSLTFDQAGGGSLTISTTWAEVIVDSSCYENILNSNLNGQKRFWLLTKGDCVIYIDNITVSNKTSYTVNHYLYKTTNESEGSVLYKTETMFGEIGSSTDAQAIMLDNYTAKVFENVVIGEETVVNIYYNRISMLVEGFDGINANGWGTPVTGSKLNDDNGNAFNIYVSNVSGLKYSVVEENGNKVLKLENVNKDGITGTWVGLVLTAEQYEAIQAGGSLSFDIKSSVEGTYTENKTGKVVSIGTEWTTVTLNKTECNTVFPTPNATYNQYVYFMYNLPADSTVYIDNIIVAPNA